jgi:hypothetical protein
MAVNRREQLYKANRTVNCTAVCNSIADSTISQRVIICKPFTDLCPVGVPPSPSYTRISQFTRGQKSYDYALHTKLKKGAEKGYQVG